MDCFWMICAYGYLRDLFYILPSKDFYYVLVLHLADGFAFV